METPIYCIRVNYNKRKLYSPTYLNTLDLSRWIDSVKLDLIEEIEIKKLN